MWLRDVLRLAGLEDEEEASSLGVKHVHFICADEPFGVSIGRRKAMAHRGDVLLAWEMNGRCLCVRAPQRVRGREMGGDWLAGPSCSVCA